MDGFRKLQPFEQDDILATMDVYLIGMRYLETDVVDALEKRMEQYKTDDSNASLSDRLTLWRCFKLSRIMIRNSRLLNDGKAHDWNSFVQYMPGGQVVTFLISLKHRVKAFLGKGGPR
jgi:alcohol dehydrogenase YqhD (iron-dependent ADH family)